MNDVDNFNSPSQPELPQSAPQEEKKEEEKKEENKPFWMPASKKQPREDKEITLSSKKNWFYVGLIIAVLNPIFAGLIVGVFFLTEKDLKREGKIILLAAIIFGFIHTYAVQKILPYFIQQGLM